MPCNSDYMGPTGVEAALSKVACLLDELEGVRWTQSHWDGFHPRVYSRGMTKKDADDMVATLCSELQRRDVTQYSLEMQIWWRDHQAADKARIEKEAQETKTEAERKTALEKLTPHERKILGL